MPVSLAHPFLTAHPRFPGELRAVHGRTGHVAVSDADPSDEAIPVYLVETASRLAKRCPTTRAWADQPRPVSVEFFPFSDFLLHDMGSLNDGIAQSGATGHEMRTAPLCGAWIRSSYLHDGRARTISAAILQAEASTTPGPSANRGSP